LRVTPVVKNSGAQALARDFRLRLCLLLPDSWLLWHEAGGVRVGPRGGGGQRAGLPQLQIPVARAYVRGALEAIGALRVTPVVHHGRLERLTLFLGGLLGSLPGSRQRRDFQSLPFGPR